VARDQAVQIMTGAPVPHDCDAVVPVEDTSGFGGSSVEIRQWVRPAANIAARGCEGRAGDTGLAAGSRLRPVDIGVLATLGATRIAVGQRARVAILSTGDELVPADSTPGPVQIRNSNGPLLAALAAPYAASVAVLGAARDDPTDLRQYIARGLDSDVLLVTGGVSMGAYDFVGGALEDAGVQFAFRRVALQPGKPTAFGRHARGFVLALPGNPVSALTTFRLFAAPLLRCLEGDSTPWPRFDSAPAAFAWERRNPKWLLVPGRRTAAGVERVAYAGSGDLLAYARADCQVVLAPHVERVTPGDAVAVWSLG
jgi:molybdopterin molybdotransferase